MNNLHSAFYRVESETLINLCLDPLRIVLNRSFTYSPENKTLTQDKTNCLFRCLFGLLAFTVCLVPSMIALAYKHFNDRYKVEFLKAHRQKEPRSHSQDPFARVPTTLPAPPQAPIVDSLSSKTNSSSGGQNSTADPLRNTISPPQSTAVPSSTSVTTSVSESRSSEVVKVTEEADGKASAPAMIKATNEQTAETPAALAAVTTPPSKEEAERKDPPPATIKAANEHPSTAPAAPTASIPHTAPSAIRTASTFSPFSSFLNSGREYGFLSRPIISSHNEKYNKSDLIRRELEEAAKIIEDKFAAETKAKAEKEAKYRETPEGRFQEIFVRALRSPKGDEFATLQFPKELETLNLTDVKGQNKGIYIYPTCFAQMVSFCERTVSTESNIKRIQLTGLEDPPLTQNSYARYRYETDGCFEDRSKTEDGYYGDSAETNVEVKLLQKMLAAARPNIQFSFSPCASYTLLSRLTCEETAALYQRLNDEDKKKLLEQTLNWLSTRSSDRQGREALDKVINTITANLDEIFSTMSLETIMTWISRLDERCINLPWKKIVSFERMEKELERCYSAPHDQDKGLKIREIFVTFLQKLHLKKDDHSKIHYYTLKLALEKAGNSVVLVKYLYRAFIKKGDLNIREWFNELLTDGQLLIIAEYFYSEVYEIDKAINATNNLSDPATVKERQAKGTQLIAQYVEMIGFYSINVSDPTQAISKEKIETNINRVKILIEGVNSSPESILSWLPKSIYSPATTVLRLMRILTITQQDTISSKESEELGGLLLLNLATVANANHPNEVKDLARALALTCTNSRQIARIFQHVPLKIQKKVAAAISQFFALEFMGALIQTDRIDLIHDAFADLWPLYNRYDHDSQNPLAQRLFGKICALQKIGLRNQVLESALQTFPSALPEENFSKEQIEEFITLSSSKQIGEYTFRVIADPTAAHLFWRCANYQIPRLGNQDSITVLSFWEEMLQRIKNMISMRIKIDPEIGREVSMKITLESVDDLVSSYL